MVFSAFSLLSHCNRGQGLLFFWRILSIHVKGTTLFQNYYALANTYMYGRRWVKKANILYRINDSVNNYSTCYHFSTTALIVGNNIFIPILQLSICVCVHMSGKYHQKLFDICQKTPFLCTSDLWCYRSSQSKQLATALPTYKSTPLWKGSRPKLDRHVRLTLPAVYRLGDGDRESFGSRGYPWMLYGCKQFYLGHVLSAVFSGFVNEAERRLTSSLVSWFKMSHVTWPPVHVQARMGTLTTYSVHCIYYYRLYKEGASSLLVRESRSIGSIVYWQALHTF